MTEDQIVRQVEKKLRGSDGLTPEDLDAYIQLPSSCVYCGHDGVQQLSSVQIEGGLAYQTIRCPKCMKSWDDIYRLVGAHCNVKHESVFATGED